MFFYDRKSCKLRMICGLSQNPEPFMNVERQYVRAL